MAEHATGEAGKVDESKTSKAEMRYSHKSNHKKPDEAGKLSGGGEGSPRMLGSAENKGDGQPHSPLAQLHAAHESEHAAMDAQHSTERSNLHRQHEANLAKHGHRPDVHKTHHEQRSAMHRAHAHAKRELNDRHTTGHLDHAGIHGGSGLAGSAEGVTAGVGQGGGPAPSGQPVAAGMGGGAAPGPMAAAGSPMTPPGAAGVA